MLTSAVLEVLEKKAGIADQGCLLGDDLADTGGGRHHEMELYCKGFAVEILCGADGFV